MKPISRRDFLKLGGLALGGLAFSSILPQTAGINFDDIDLVRVATDTLSVYSQPDDKSRIVRTWPRDSLIHVYETVDSGTPGYNPIWYRVFGGYMHRARLQKVRWHYNAPLPSIPATKLLAEVTVPYTDAYQYNKWDGWHITYRLYYTSIQWLVGVDAGPDGSAWYLIQDEADETIHYVPAMHLRPIAPEELAPITPGVPVGKKIIDVNVSSQILTCTESNKVVFTTNVSTGVSGLNTPTGHFNIMVKLPSRHMSTSSPLADDIALVGVPWCSFFTGQGHAFHGTYWHDNFGVPMSHGCVNMRNEDALWLFRWSQPEASFDDIDKQTLDVKGYGALVNIHN